MVMRWMALVARIKLPSNMQHQGSNSGTEVRSPERLPQSYSPRPPSELVTIKGELETVTLFLTTAVQLKQLHLFSMSFSLCRTARYISDWNNFLFRVLCCSNYFTVLLFPIHVELLVQASLHNNGTRQTNNSLIVQLSFFVLIFPWIRAR